MAYKLIIKPLAERDITETYQWYNEQQAGLGDDFLDELERTLNFIKANPNQYQIRYKEVRMTKVRRFPICLHYTLTDQAIFVQAVLSTSRNPRIWKERN